MRSIIVVVVCAWVIISSSKDASFHGFPAAYERLGGGDGVAFGALMAKRRRVRPRMKNQVEKQQYMLVVLRRNMQAGIRFV